MDLMPEKKQMNNDHCNLREINFQQEEYNFKDRKFRKFPWKSNFFMYCHKASKYEKIGQRKTANIYSKRRV